jgi:anti-anti-sigma regulatory factor
LEGRITGPWAAELSRAWSELEPTLGQRKLSLDLSNATYADADGIGILREIYSKTAAAFITSSPWTKYLAEEVKLGSATQSVEEL